MRALTAFSSTSILRCNFLWKCITIEGGRCQSRGSCIIAGSLTFTVIRIPLHHHGLSYLPEARHICLAFDNALLDGLGRRQVLRHLTQKKVLYAQHCSDIVDETLDQL